ncbi:DoxX family protein [Streptantibioticus ferralitis]|uniref:DoxX family protein n=1 Tax=Streptantibioticus ferralitis TaxID=236510 RepID=A0ABT5Z765_9ACTN|nr:DoxX family protein [Streptantibioticus ferralitis]
MSVDTRTPRSSTGGRSPGFEEDVLNTVRVPSDPAQVIVNHASFRVKLGTSPPTPRYDPADDTTPIPVIPTSVRSAAEARMPRRRRAAPVVWSGHTEPGDPAATQLLQAVRSAGGTQLLPRVGEQLRDDDLDDGMPPVRPAVVAPRSPVVGGPPPGEPHGGVRPSRDAYGEDAYDTPPHGASYGDRYIDERDERDDYETRADRRDRRRGEPVRHAWYPGRRMNLGVVLLPLRIFLGFISIYAGLGKLCDPVYFDGGERGSMVHWLHALHPWSAAEPLRAAALAHPVGAGLTVAFLQVTVGVLTIMGLWQRMAASFGALLSVALLMTVSWRTVPVYDAPDIIYLAAWSPLVIAGAPVYSVDAKLAGEAWRRLGPRAPLWDLRRYVLRRGIVLATFAAGGTLVLGAVLGSAVRASHTHIVQPSVPSDLPTNDLPGSPLPQAPDTGAPSPRHSLVPGAAHGSKSPSADASSAAATAGTPGASATSGAGAVGGRSHLGGGTAGRRRLPSQDQTVQAPHDSAPAPRSEPANPPPSSGGSSTGGSLGGLLGSKPPTGWLLGMPGERRAPASNGMA